MATAMLAAAAACSSSSSDVTTPTSPTSVRCPVGLSAAPSSVEAAGGSGQISISVNRECTWEARSEADWIALAAPTSGQGEATLGFTAAPNTAVSTRRGSVLVNEQRVEITQGAAACRFDLSAPGGSVTAEGGALTVNVTAQATCRWAATSQVEWIRVDGGREGDGSGVVTMSVTRNTGPAREGTVMVAGHPYVVRQAGPTPTSPTPPAPPGPTPPANPTPPACTFTVSPQTESFGADGGEGTVRVQPSQPSCAWSAVSNVPWITVRGNDDGGGLLRYEVAANAGAARTGLLTVAGTTVTITQAAAPACEFGVSPQSQSIGANGGDGSVRVETSRSSCTWTAASNVPWITLTTGNGTGNGNVRYMVAANTGAARTGTMSVAGVTVTVSQAAAPSCTFTVSPLSESVSASGGNGSIRVEASASSCAWTASSNATWIVLGTGGATGNGNVSYAVAPNTGAARTGTVAVAGATVTISQAAAPTGTIELRGRISGLGGTCPNLTFTQEGVRVITTAATEFVERCDRIRDGRDYMVNGLVQPDGSVLALRIRDN